MIANNSQVLTEASKTLYRLNADEIMQQRCRARQDFILYENAMKRQNQTLSAEKEELSRKVDTLTAENEELNRKSDALTAEKEAWLAERKQLLTKLAEYETKGIFT